MSEVKKIELNLLYSTLVREIENELVQELEPQFYRYLAEYLGKLKSETYDGIESKIKNRLVEMITQIVTLIIKIRINKVSHGGLNLSNLLDEEKYIIESVQDQKERKEMILSATLNGRTKLLESVSKKHKTKLVSVRFLKDFDQFVGADMSKYGPYMAEEIATIPNENAMALVAKNITVKISVD